MAVVVPYRILFHALAISVRLGSIFHSWNWKTSDLPRPAPPLKTKTLLVSLRMNVARFSSICDHFGWLTLVLLSCLSTLWRFRDGVDPAGSSRSSWEGLDVCIVSPRSKLQNCAHDFGPTAASHRHVFILRKDLIEFSGDKSHYHRHKIALLSQERSGFLFFFGSSS